MILDEVCVSVAKDNMLKAKIAILVEETLVDDILQFRFQFVMRNSYVDCREIERFYAVNRAKKLAFK